MTKLDLKLVALRKVIRSNGSKIIKYLSTNYIYRDSNGRAIKNIAPPICMFCSTGDNITKEHILPRWTFSKDDKAFFNIGANGQSQSYQKSTIPVCSTCNGKLLNILEKEIQAIFACFHDDENYIDNEASFSIIRWLEIIDYKFQVMNVTKRFVSHKKGEHVPYLKDFPLYMLLPNRDWSPTKVISEVRWTLNRISIKSKASNLNSLVIFRTTNKGNHFFHTLNDFIFIEIAKYSIAVFYFYESEFNTIEEAHEAAMIVIDKVY